MEAAKAVLAEGVEAGGKQRVRKVFGGGGAAAADDVHQGRGVGGLEAAVDVARGPRGGGVGVRDEASEGEGNDRPAFPGEHCGVSAADVAVLVRFLRPFHFQARFRADADGHG